jgi:hypothetical protein
MNHFSCFFVIHDGVELRFTYLLVNIHVSCYISCLLCLCLVAPLCYLKFTWRLLFWTQLLLLMVSDCLFLRIHAFGWPSTFLVFPAPFDLSGGIYAAPSFYVVGRGGRSSFDGGYKKWTLFRDTFNSLVIPNRSLGKIQKYHYLQKIHKTFAEKCGISTGFPSSPYLQIPLIQKSCVSNN